MTLEKRKNSTGSLIYLLTECPVEGCNKDLEGYTRKVDHLQEHDLSDFNLD